MTVWELGKRDTDEHLIFVIEFLVKCLIHVPSMESLLDCFLWHLYHLESQKETDGVLTLGNSGELNKETAKAWAV